MGTVYGISCGCYSDYRVLAIFSSKEKAEEALKVKEEFKVNSLNRYDYASMAIEEFSLDPGIDVVRECISGDRKKFRIDYGLDGRITSIQNVDAEFDDALGYASGFVYPIVDYTAKAVVSKVGICVYVLARDEEHAIKIAWQRRREFLANH